MPGKKKAARKKKREEKAAAAEAPAAAAGGGAQSVVPDPGVPFDYQILVTENDWQTGRESETFKTFLKTHPDQRSQKPEYAFFTKIDTLKQARTTFDQEAETESFNFLAGGFCLLSFKLTGSMTEGSIITIDLPWQVEEYSISHANLQAFRIDHETYELYHLPVLPVTEDDDLQIEAFMFIEQIAQYYLSQSGIRQYTWWPFKEGLRILNEIEEHDDRIQEHLYVNYPWEETAFEINPAKEKGEWIFPGGRPVPTRDVFKDIRNGDLRVYKGLPSLPIPRNTYDGLKENLCVGTVEDVSPGVVRYTFYISDETKRFEYNIFDTRTPVTMQDAYHADHEQKKFEKEVMDRHKAAQKENEKERRQEQQQLSKIKSQRAKTALAGHLAAENRAAENRAAEWASDDEEPSSSSSEDETRGAAKAKPRGGLSSPKQLPRPLPKPPQTSQQARTDLLELIEECYGASARGNDVWELPGTQPQIHLSFHEITRGNRGSVHFKKHIEEPHFQWEEWLARIPQTKPGQIPAIGTFYYYEEHETGHNDAVAGQILTLEAAGRVSREHTGAHGLDPDDNVVLANGVTLRVTGRQINSIYKYVNDAIRKKFDVTYPDAAGGVRTFEFGDQLHLLF